MFRASQDLSCEIQVCVELALLPQLPEALFLTVFPRRNNYAYNWRPALLEIAVHQCFICYTRP